MSKITIEFPDSKEMRSLLRTLSCLCVEDNIESLKIDLEEAEVYEFDKGPIQKKIDVNNVFHDTVTAVLFSGNSDNADVSVTGGNDNDA